VTTLPGVRKYFKGECANAKRCSLRQDSEKELCPQRRNPGHAEPAGDPEKLLQLVPRYRPAGGVQGCGHRHRLFRQP